MSFYYKFNEFNILNIILLLILTSKTPNSLNLIPFDIILLRI